MKQFVQCNPIFKEKYTYVLYMHVCVHIRQTERIFNYIFQHLSLGIYLQKESLFFSIFSSFPLSICFIIINNRMYTFLFIRGVNYKRKYAWKDS